MQVARVQATSHIACEKDYRSVILIQSLQRGRVVRTAINKQRLAANEIQRVYRGLIDRRIVKEIRRKNAQDLLELKSITIIQRHCRGFMGRKRFKRERDVFNKRELAYFQAVTKYQTDPSNPDRVANYVAFTHATQMNSYTDTAKLYVKVSLFF